MKHLILIFLIAALSFISVPHQSMALLVDDQPCIELSMACDVEAPVFSVEALTPGLCVAILHEQNGKKCLAPTHYKQRNVDFTLGKVAKAHKYPIQTFKRPRVNCAGFGAFLLTDSDTEAVDPGGVVVDDTDSSQNGTILGWIMANSLVIVTALLGLSELLALIPGLKANGLLSAIILGLKNLKNKLPTDNTN